MELIEIAALGKHGQLGLKGDMPWTNTMKEDLKFFRSQTKGHPIVMGRKTWQSLPGMLPGRKHIVISASGADVPEGVDQYASVEAFLEDWKDRNGTVYVIGGGSIYKAFLPHADKLVLTRFEKDFEADVFFPDFDENLYEASPMDDAYEENGILCRHWQYKRK